jgi:hypothetical protein
MGEQLGVIRNVITGIVGVGIVSAGAFALDATTRDESGVIVESGELGVFDFQVGDCIADLPTGEVNKAVGTPCSEPHQFEVFAETYLSNASETLPADIEVQADEFCISEFDQFVGLPLEESVLNFSWLVPTSESWATGDKEITCLIHEKDEATISVSLRGSKR